MYLTVGLIVRIFGKRCLLFGQGRKVVVLVQYGALREPFYPTPDSRGGTTYTVVNRPTGFVDRITRQCCFVLYLIAICVRDGERCALAHMRSMRQRRVVQGTHGLQRVIRDRVGARIGSKTLISDRHSIREIRLESTLHFEHIVIHQVFGTRAADSPTQLHIARHTLLLVQDLFRLEIVDSVVGRDIDLIGFDGIALHRRVLRHIYAEGGIEPALHGIGGRHDDHAGFLVDRCLRCIERSMVAHRLLEDRVLDRRVSVAGGTLFVQGIEIGREQLGRLGEAHIEFVLIRPPFAKPRFRAGVLEDMRTNAPVEVLSCQLLRNVPVDGEIGDVSMIVIHFTLEVHRLVVLPIGVVACGYRLLLSLPDTLDHYATGMDIDIAFPFVLVVVGLVLAPPYGSDGRDTVYIPGSPLLVRFEGVPDVGIVDIGPVVRAIKVIVVDGSIHPDRDIEAVYAVTHVHHRVMLTMLQIIIRSHARCQCQQANER